MFSCFESELTDVLIPLITVMICLTCLIRVRQVCIAVPLVNVIIYFAGLRRVRQVCIARIVSRTFWSVAFKELLDSGLAKTMSTSSTKILLAWKIHLKVPSFT